MAVAPLRPAAAAAEEKKRKTASRNSSGSVEKKINYVLHKYNEAEIPKVEGFPQRKDVTETGTWRLVRATVLLTCNHETGIGAKAKAKLATTQEANL